MKKVFALVRIVHRKEPESLTIDELAQLYGEALFYETMKAELLAEQLKKQIG